MTMFKPFFTITPEIMAYLMRLEALREEIKGLPITPFMLASLRETARLESIHFSTQIEGNRLTQEEVIQVIKNGEYFPGRERDQNELWDYLAGLDAVEKFVASSAPLTEKFIQKLHGLVMADGKTKVKPTPYRDGQNVIRDSSTNKIVYLPPESHDVPGLMKELVIWVNYSEKTNFPRPLIAAIAHYQFATIHPYYDGNGRTARLLMTFILRRGKYDLNGIYSHEECYAKNIPAYYQALDVGGHHNYYMGRETADITGSINYFCACLVESFEKVRPYAAIAAKQGDKDKSGELRKLDPRQRKALVLFETTFIITSKEVEQLFKISARTARLLCQQWVEEGFLTLQNASKKARSYELAPVFQSLV